MRKNRFERAAERAAEHAQQSTKAAKDSAKHSLAAASESASRSARSAKDAAIESGECAGQYARAHPALTIGGLAALALGLIIGALAMQLAPTFARYLKMRSM